MGAIDISIAVDDSQVSKLDTAGQKIDALGQKSETAGQSAKTVGVGLTALGAAGVGAFGSALNSAADFEQQLSGIASVGGQDAVNQMDQIKAAALEMGARTSFSAGEAAAGMEELIKAGIPVTDVINGVASASLDLAAAGGVSVVDAAGDMTQAVQVFGSNATDVADTFAEVANASATGVNEIAAGFGNVAPVAKGFGLSMQDTAEAIGVMSNAGIDGAEAGTMLKSMLLSLYTPSVQQKKAMTELGLSTQDFVDSSGKLIGIPEMFAKIKSSSEALGVPMGDVKEDMATIFGSYGITAASTFFDVQQKGFDDLETGMKNAGTAQEQAAKRLDNLKGAAEALSGSLETAGIAVGQGLIGPVRMLTEFVTGLVNAFLTLPQPVQQAIGLIGGLASVLAAGLGAAILIVPKILEFTKAMQGLGVASRVAGLAFGPLGIALAAVGLGVLAYRTNFLGFGDAVDRVAAGVKTFATGVQSLMEKGLSPFDALMTQIRRSLRENGFDQAATMVADFARAATDAIGVVKTFGSILKEAVTQGEFMSDFLMNLPEPLRNLGIVFGGVVAAISDFVKAISGGQGLAAAWAEVTKVFSNTYFQTALDGLKQQLTSIDWSGIGNNIRTGLQNVIDSVSGAAMDLGSWVLNVGAPTIIGWIKDHNPIDWIRENIGLTHDASGGFTIDFGPWTLSLPSPDVLIEADQTLTANILEAIRKLLTVSPEFVTGAGEIGQELGRDMGDAIATGITAALNAVLGGGGGGGGGVGGSIDAALRSGQGFGASTFSLGDAFANFDTEFTAAFKAALDPAVERAKAAISDYVHTTFQNFWLDINLAIQGALEVFTGSMPAGLGGTLGQGGNIFQTIQQTIFDQLNALDWSNLPNPFQGASDKLAQYLNDFTANPFSIGGVGGGGGGGDVSAAGLATGQEVGTSYSTSLGEGMGAGLDAGLPVIQSNAQSLGDKLGELGSWIFGVEDAQAVSTDIATNIEPAITDGVTTGIGDGLANLSTAMASGAGFGATMSGGGGVGQTIADGIATSAEGADYSGLTDAVSAGISDAVAAATTTAESGDTVGRALIASIITGLNAIAATVSTAVETTIQSAITAGDAKASGAVSNGQQIITTMVAGIDQTAGNVTSSVETAIGNAISAGDQKASGADAVGTSLINALIDGMNAVQNNVATGVENTVQAAIDAGTSTAAGATSVGSDIVTNIGSGIDSGSGTLGSTLQNAVLGAIQAVGALAGAAHDAGTAIGQALGQGIADGVRAGLAGVASEINGMIAQLANAANITIPVNVTTTVTGESVQGAYDAGAGLGAPIVQGEVDAVNAGVPAATDAGANLVGGTIAGAAAVGGIHSPSTVMIAMGQDIVDGLVIGIVDNIPGVVDAAGQMIEPLNKLESDLAAMAARAGDEYVTNLANAIASGEHFFVNEAGDIVDKAGNYLTETFTVATADLTSTMGDVGTLTLDELEKAFYDGTDGVTAAGTYVADAAMAPIAAMPADAATAAADTVLGAADVMLNAAPVLADAAATAAGGVTSEFASMYNHIVDIVNGILEQAGIAAHAASHIGSSSASDASSSHKSKSVNIDKSGGTATGKRAHASGGHVHRGDIHGNADVSINVSGGTATSDRSGSDGNNRRGGNTTNNYYVRDGRHMARESRRQHRQQRLAAGRGA
jgi:TP901 family phage tail tape measure protein